MALAGGFAFVALLMVSNAADLSKDVLTLGGATAVAYDQDEQPMFSGPRDYILSVADNAEGKLFAWDPERRRVRVSPDDVPALWLSCRDLAPMTVSCPAVAPPDASGKPTRGAGDGPVGPRQGIPSCPIDPRCPRIDR